MHCGSFYFYFWSTQKAIVYRPEMILSYQLQSVYKSTTAKYNLADNEIDTGVNLATKAATLD